MSETRTSTGGTATGRAMRLVERGLWLLAGALAGAMLFGGERGGGGLGATITIPGVSAANAAVVSKAGALTVLTAEGTNDEMLMVLDSRREELLVYRTSAQNGMQLFQRIPLADLFRDARLRARGQ
ncbi:MAG: hypothetical protein AB7Q00_03420 [Phycisphaerales bacterium]